VAAVHLQAAQPIKSLDGPALGVYKSSVPAEPDDSLGDVLHPDEVEGGEDTDAACMEARAMEGILQHDIDVVLWTLPARERNVRSLLLNALSLLLLDLKACRCMLADCFSDCSPSAARTWELLYQLCQHAERLRGQILRTTACAATVYHMALKVTVAVVGDCCGCECLSD
jgi:hypothetical protein